MKKEANQPMKKAASTRYSDVKQDKMLIKKMVKKDCRKKGIT